MIVMLPSRNALRTIPVMIATAASAGVVGFCLAWLGAAFGFYAIAVPVGACLFICAVLARPDVALLAVPLAIPVGTIQVPGVPLRVIHVSVVVAVGLATIARLLRGRRAFAWPTPLWWAVGFTGAVVPATAPRDGCWRRYQRVDHDRLRTSAGRFDRSL